MRCAVVDASNNVINVIVADPETDLAPDGCTLIALRDDSPVQVGWKYSLAKNRFTLLLTDEPLDNG
jgi:hypothetical protein